MMAREKKGTPADEGVVKVEPKFLQEGWGKKLKAERKKQKHAVPKDQWPAFRVDVHRGIQHVMDKYSLTEAEVRSELKKIVPGFNQDLLRS